MDIRIGQGYDLHRLKAGRRLVVGGVEIPHDFGLDGHSDADVLLHAVIDALLGALALGDIGQCFPDTSDKYLDADSAVLLKTVLADSRFAAWKINNIDCTVFAEAPKFAPWRDKIRLSLSTLLNCPIDCVSIKAKTNEKQDAIGQKLAIAAAASVLLVRQEQ